VVSDKTHKKNVSPTLLHPFTVEGRVGPHDDERLALAEMTTMPTPRSATVTSCKRRFILRFQNELEMSLSKMEMTNALVPCIQKVSVVISE
jgi:hypothetical protein